MITAIFLISGIINWILKECKEAAYSFLGIPLGMVIDIILFDILK